MSKKPGDPFDSLPITPNDRWTFDCLCGWSGDLPELESLDKAPEEFFYNYKLLCPDCGREIKMDTMFDWHNTTVAEMRNCRHWFYWSDVEYLEESLNTISFAENTLLQEAYQLGLNVRIEWSELPEGK